MMSNNTVLAAGEAMPIARRPISMEAKIPACSLTIDQIEMMTMRERRSYYDALRLAEMAIGGIINQPRYTVEKTNILNGAGKRLDHLQDFLLESIDLLVKETRKAEPTDPDEAEQKAWLILIYEASCSDALPDFVAVAAQQAVAVANVEFAVRHGGRK